MILLDSNLWVFGTLGTNDRATALLAEIEQGEQLEPLPADEIDYRLEYLQNHGEIYYVEDWIRITDPEEVEDDFVNGDDENESEVD